MGKCETCGNEYEKSFEITREGQLHMFDCFECAIHALAPVCANCGCRIIGHGVESDDRCFCGAHCAKQMGVEEVQDRA
jgi:hypothetical protein